MKQEKVSKINVLIDRLLGYLYSIYGSIKKLLGKNKNMALIYNQINSLLKSQLIMINKDSELFHYPNLNVLADSLTDNIIKKVPNVDESLVKKFVKRNIPYTFQEIFTASQDPYKKEYTLLKKEKLFKKILIANRGEIALRIIRACRELGIKTVVIYSKSDKEALAVKFADKAYCISRKDSANDYLNIKKIIKIAKKTKCEAIHPGYGFISENADFARICEKNKIKFIGPSVSAIELIENKVTARELMINNGIPVVTGTKKALENEDMALQIANKIGYPVILKAVSGGGGKGMRVVNKKEDVIPSFKSAKLEAEACFGDGRLYIEKYVESPRHIEFQILADRYGNIVHLGERECTIQRRHQKLIEETPSPALSKSLREKMGQAAIQIAKLTNFEGAGTVEFLLDKNKNFYFMEMNKRVQVEHGITEMVTNIDIIKEQIKIASGAKLAFAQEDIKIDCWAIECRINAESPTNDFQPCPGTITEYLPPGGPGIRICSSCYSGYKISPQYDSLIAKLICSGKTRHEAIERTKRALGEYIINGVETTIPFHLSILNNNRFISGNFSTSFIEDEDILKKLKKPKLKKGNMNKEQKLIVVSTAVSKYLEKKNKMKNNNESWTSAARQESLNNNQQGEML